MSDPTTTTSVAELPSGEETTNQPNTTSSTTTPPAQPPISHNRLEEITRKACQTTLQDVTEYNHSQCQTWNGAIIHSILERLIDEGSPKGTYKFVVNSTIVQHALAGEGRRGMHSATAGYWNMERDGMWNFKFDGSGSSGEEAGRGLGLDVVVCVFWIAVA